MPNCYSSGSKHKYHKIHTIQDLPAVACIMCHAQYDFKIKLLRLSFQVTGCIAHTPHTNILHISEKERAAFYLWIAIGSVLNSLTMLAMYSLLSAAAHSSGAFIWRFEDHLPGKIGLNIWSYQHCNNLFTAAVRVDTACELLISVMQLFLHQTAGNIMFHILLIS